PILFSFDCPVVLVALPSFPTRRSSDLGDGPGEGDAGGGRQDLRTSIDDHRVDQQRRDDVGQDYAKGGLLIGVGKGHGVGQEIARDRKSTRLNSSHVKISYAVFCLKKKI